MVSRPARHGTRVLQPCHSSASRSRIRDTRGRKSLFNQNRDREGANRSQVEGLPESGRGASPPEVPARRDRHRIVATLKTPSRKCGTDFLVGQTGWKACSTQVVFGALRD